MRPVQVAVSSWIFVVLLLHRIRTQEGICQTGNIRLSGGSSYLEGRVEVCFRGEWGTVCDDKWDETDANVACRQLGYSETGALSFSNAHFGEGHGTVVLDDLECNGNESKLIGCLLKNDCYHSEDAGVRCQANDVALTHKGQLLLNNSVISLDALGNSSASTTNSLFCITTLPSCCDTNRTGNWFPPVGSIPLGTASNHSYLHQSWGDDQSIQLHSPSGEASIEQGLYRCEVLDRVSTMRVLYVGIYFSADDGIMEITSLAFERSSQTLICTSSGGPATSVSWTKDGEPLTVDGITYQHSQIITDTASATYENRLRIVSISYAVSGIYSCLVMNSRGQATHFMEVKVCRDDEIRMVRDDVISATLQVCMDNEWLDITSPLQIQAIELAPRNVQISAYQDGFLLRWESPHPNQNITSYEVACAEESLLGGQISVLLDGKTLSAILPLIPGGISTDYQCCVKTHMNRYGGLKFTAESCLNASSSPNGGVIFPSVAQTLSNDRILVLALGVISGVLFLALFWTLVVSMIFCFRNKGEGIKVSQKHVGTHKNGANASVIKEEYDVGIIQPASNVIHPIYQSIENEAANTLPRTTLQETVPVLSPSVSLRKDILNPLYSSIDDFEFSSQNSSSLGQNFSSLDHHSFSQNEAFRRHTTAGSEGRRTSSGNVPGLVPMYSMIVPRHLRRKSTNSMDIEDQVDQLNASINQDDDNSALQL